MPTVDEPGRVASGILALLVHLLFLGMLVIGISWQKKIIGPVVVDLWEELPEPVTKVSPPPPKIVEPPPRPAPEVKKEPPPPPPPKVEAPPKPTPAEIELREKLRKQKEEEAERREEQKIAEAERKEEQKKVELEKRKLEEEKRKEDEARRADEQKRMDEQRRIDEAKQEDERKQRAAVAESERLQQEAAHKREAEETKRRAEAAAARAAKQKLIDDWTARIKMKIKGLVRVPDNIQGNPEARFDVVLLPGGEVLSATRGKSSGVPAYDDAVERAIMAAQPLPVPSETELFQENFRELALVFRPKD